MRPSITLFQSRTGARRPRRTEEEGADLDALRTGDEQCAVWLADVPEAQLSEQVTLPLGVIRHPDAAGASNTRDTRARKLMTIERMLGVVPRIARDRQARMASLTQPART